MKKIEDFSQAERDEAVEILKRQPQSQAIQWLIEEIEQCSQSSEKATDTGRPPLPENK